ncbi:MoaD/ThiS family protein [Mechercharimyces sp. CAU 1602]|uniref:MoaD/ThiS family protein n=1 Tax=Mechercharimyces sp. CAU 1602 TaxID=2973933 RepID=UPI002161C778|nr:MoaD/ThiS family protein [Mechercharimyces sp. CAU 1602]MCS1350093.1 MoaD/ThiS family protein [Mechercharimyces sp. CAU 1602]
MGNARISIFCFGALRQELGDWIKVELNTPCTLQDLKEKVIEEYPSSERIVPSCMIAVNQICVADKTFITGSEEIALIPPFSGG